MHTYLKENGLSAEHAIEIGPGIWWVGHQIPGDKLQCHAYLIENGNESVLIDPGSALTIEETLKKIEEVTAFSNIRYFICHHQEPDITGSLKRIDEVVTRDDAVIVTHRRAEALLKHYALKLPMWLVDSNDWRLDLGGRVLKFIFTPYLPFPGAFCTFDEESGTLFSGGLFGGFTTEEPSLFAADESYFESMRPFHEHYMPSREILQNALLSIEEEAVRMIAPRHGSIIPEGLVAYMMEKLKGLECGLYLMAKKDSDVTRLMELNNKVKGFTNAQVTYRDFSDIAHYLCGVAREILPVETMEFYVMREGGEKLICFAPENKYHGEVISRISFIASVIKNIVDGPVEGEGVVCERIKIEKHGKTKDAVAMRLDINGENKTHAVAIFTLGDEAGISGELNELARMSLPLSAAIEREAIYHMLEEERNAIYEGSIRDPLTGLFTRYYMNDSANRLLERHDRDDTLGVALIIVDLDHFRQVNDKYGHTTGDMVLKSVGKVILEEVRKVDIPVRYGGGEFAIFLPAKDVYIASMIAERIRKAIGGQVFTCGEENFNVTMSGGVAIHMQDESLLEFITRTEKALYSAKESGRDRSCRAR